MAVIRYNADGSIDTTFNGGAPAFVGVAGQTWMASAVAVRPTDGEIIVGGEFEPAGGPNYNIALARFTATGAADGTQTLITSGGEINAMVAQPDGKILLGATVGNAFAVIRLNTDNTVDPTFGGASSATATFPTYSEVAGMALQPDGKVVVVGTTGSGNYTSHFAAARFTATGQLDPTFGIGGMVQTDVPGWYEEAHAVALQPDGKVVVAGNVSQPGAFPPSYDFALVRYNADGSLDTTFGASGFAVNDFGASDTAAAAAVEPDGTIVVGGATGTGLKVTPILARYQPGGGLGSSLGGTGGGIGALALQSGGRVIAASSPSVPYNSGATVAYTGPVALAASDSLTVTAPGVTANNDSYQVAKATPLAVPASAGVLANDTAAGGATLTAVLVAAAAHGKLTLNADGSFTYTPTGAYLGVDSFTYQASDGTFKSNVATVGLTIAGSDDPPVSGDDSYLFANQPGTTGLAVFTPGVLTNDSDPNGQAITAVLASAPAHGTLTLNADGSFQYLPAANFFGTDSFTYRASDGQLLGNLATVTIKSFGYPVAGVDQYSTPENVPLSVAAPGILANDSDPNGGTLQPVVTSFTTNGTLTVNPDGSFAYTPKANYYGTDSFDYYVTDGAYSSLVVTDTIVVTQVDHPPVATDVSYTVAEDSTLAAIPIVTSIQLTSQPGDPIGQGQSYLYDTTSATFTPFGYPNVFRLLVKGNTTRYSNGEAFEFEFSPAYGQTLGLGTYTGAMRYGFQDAGDPGLDVDVDDRGSNTLTGQFTVYQVDRDASGNIDAFAADFEQQSDGAIPALTGRVQYRSTLGQPAGVLTNATDPENAPLTARVVAGPSHGTLGFNADGSFQYVPMPGFSGTDQFSYVANDGQLDSNVATATITVNQTKLLDDPGFEGSRVGSGFAYDPAGTAWTYAGGAGVSGNSSAFTSGNPAAPEGSQVALLQGAGSSVSQTLYNWAAGNYTLSFQAAQRGNDGTSVEDFQVLVDGTVVGTFRPSGTSYQAYSTPAFTVTAGSHVVQFAGLDTAGGDNTAFLDKVSVAASAPPTVPTVGDAGFEGSRVGSGFAYDPGGTAWVYAGGAGVSGNSSAFTSGNPAAPEGSQVAFLQGSVSSVNQVIAGWQAGSYQVSFQAAQRGNDGTSVQDFEVLVDGTVVGTFQPTGTSYQAFVTPAFTVAAGSHVVQFVGLDTAGGDNTAFLDAVSVSAYTPPTVPTVGDAGFEAAGVGSGFAYGPTNSAWTFAGNAGVSGNNSAFTSGNPAAPQGSQVAFLQQTGSISQAVDGWAAGSYTLSFQAAQRGNFGTSVQDFQVYIDDTLVGTFQPTGTSYQLLQTKAFAVAAGKHVITFRGLDSAGGDNTAFIDDVRLTRA